MRLAPMHGNCWGFCSTMPDGSLWNPDSRSSSHGLENLRRDLMAERSPRVPGGKFLDRAVGEADHFVADGAADMRTDHRLLSSFFPLPLSGEGAVRMRRMSEAGEGSPRETESDPSSRPSMRALHSTAP